MKMGMRECKGLSKSLGSKVAIWLKRLKFEMYASQLQNHLLVHSLNFRLKFNNRPEMCKVLCWQRDEGTRERKHITVVPSLFPTVHLNKSQEEDFTSLFFSHHFLKKPKLNSTHAWSTATSTWICSSSSSRYPRQQGNLPSRLQRWISNWLEKMHEPFSKLWLQRSTAQSKWILARNIA